MKVQKFGIGFCLILFAAAYAQAQMSEATVKALFIYNFSKYIEWPAAKVTGPFVIGVVGSDEVLKELEQISKSKRVKDRFILAKKITDPAEVANCNIVFITEGGSSFLKHAEEFGKENGVLVVTENLDYKTKVYAINIIEQKNKIRFELNEAVAHKAGLKFSNELILLSAKTN